MKRQNFYGFTALIAGATLLSRVLGLVREQLFAYFFGAGLVSDAFQIAFRIPNLLRDLFAEGAMSSALVPVYTRSRIQEGEASAWQLISKTLTVLALALAFFTVLGIVFADFLVHLYAPAFSLEPGKHELTVRLTKLLWPFLPLVAFAAVFMGALNARERFKAPAFASSVFNILTISLMLVLCPFSARFGVRPIYGMAAAVLVGALGQWLMQWPSLRQEGFSFRFYRHLWDPRVKEILWLMGVGTFALAATQVNILINSFLASGQGEGAVSWLHYAFRFMQFPIGIFGAAIATTTLTKVSQEVAREDLTAVRSSLHESLRMVFVLTIPSSVGLVLLGTPIIAVIYQHGRFSAGDTTATSMALAAYSLGLAAYSAIKVLVPVFYSLGNAKVAIYASFASVAFNTVLCLLFLKPLGFVGLALATSASSMAHCIILLWFLQRKLRNLDFRDIARCFGKVLISSMGMGIVLVLFLNRVGLPLFAPIPLTGLWSGARFSLRLLLLAAALGSGIITYTLCARVLRVQEISRLKDFIWKQSSYRREML